MIIFVSNLLKMLPRNVVLLRWDLDEYERYLSFCFKQKPSSQFTHSWLYLYAANSHEHYICGQFDWFKLLL